MTSEAIDDFFKENKNLNQNDLIKIALDVSIKIVENFQFIKLIIPFFFNKKSDLRNVGAKFLPELATSGKVENV